MSMGSPPLLGSLAVAGIASVGSLLAKKNKPHRPKTKCGEFPDFSNPLTKTARANANDTQGFMNGGVQVSG